MALYVGGGWFRERSDRLLVAAGKKDVGGCLPRVPSHPGFWQGGCSTSAVPKPGGGRRGTHCWMDLAWSLPRCLINTAASAAAPSHSHTFQGALWGQKKRKTTALTQFRYGFAFSLFQTLSSSLLIRCKLTGEGEKKREKLKLIFSPPSCTFFLLEKFTAACPHPKSMTSDVVWMHYLKGLWPKALGKTHSPHEITQVTDKSKKLFLHIT